MDSLKIDSGQIELSINNDPEKTIKFSPSDVLFAERFYDLFSKMKDYQTRIKALENGTGQVIEDKIPESIKLMHEACDFVRSNIDKLFGDGKAQEIFGDTMDLEVFAQLFTGIMPYVEKKRNEKMSKYIIGKRQDEATANASELVKLRKRGRPSKK